MTDIINLPRSLKCPGCSCADDTYWLLSKPPFLDEIELQCNKCDHVFSADSIVMGGRVYSKSEIAEDVPRATICSRCHVEYMRGHKEAREEHLLNLRKSFKLFMEKKSA